MSPELHLEMKTLSERESRGGLTQGSRLNVPVVLLLGITCLASAGCSPSQTVVPGTVTLDGEPLDQAGLEFHGSGAGGFTGHAFTDANGQYRAKVAASPLVVVIRATTFVGMQKQPNIPGGTVQPEFEQYFTGADAMTPRAATCMIARS